MTLSPIHRSYFHLMQGDTIVCSVSRVDGKIMTKDGSFESEEQLFEYYTKWNLD